MPGPGSTDSINSDRKFFEKKQLEQEMFNLKMGAVEFEELYRELQIEKRLESAQISEQVERKYIERLEASEQRFNAAIEKYQEAEKKPVSNSQPEQKEKVLTEQKKKLEEAIKASEEVKNDIISLGTSGLKDKTQNWLQESFGIKPASLDVKINLGDGKDPAALSTVLDKLTADLTTELRNNLRTGLAFGDKSPHGQAMMKIKFVGFAIDYTRALKSLNEKLPPEHRFPVRDVSVKEWTAFAEKHCNGNIEALMQNMDKFIKADQQAIDLQSKKAALDKDQPAPEKLSVANAQVKVKPLSTFDPDEGSRYALQINRSNSSTILREACRNYSAATGRTLTMSDKMGDDIVHFTLDGKKDAFTYNKATGEFSTGNSSVKDITAMLEIAKATKHKLELTTSDPQLSATLAKTADISVGVSVKKGEEEKASIGAEKHAAIPDAPPLESQSYARPSGPKA